MAGEGWGFEVTGGNAVGIFISKVSSSRKELQVRGNKITVAIAYKLCTYRCMLVKCIDTLQKVYLVIFDFVHRLVTRFLSWEVKMQLV